MKKSLAACVLTQAFNHLLVYQCLTERCNKLTTELISSMTVCSNLKYVNKKQVQKKLLCDSLKVATHLEFQTKFERLPLLHYTTLP